jgi:CDP-diacylglycerol--glycerol-3-phosphate 3-phosphatidyltransferase
MNLPNKITLLRVLVIPFFVFFMLTDVFGGAGRWIALVIFCVASFTDYLDGYLARKYDCVTSLGKFMDPLADKLLVGAAMICLVGLNLLEAWVVVVIISGFRLVAVDNGVVIAASSWGKYKTIFQMAMIIVLIANLGGIFHCIGAVLVWMSLILTIISMVDYIYKNRSVLMDNKE